MSETFDGTLDLTGARPDEVGFPAIPSGSYPAHVARAEWKATENIDGSKALPHGTPYLSLGIQVNEDVEPRTNADGEEQTVANAYAGWVNLFVPPADYDAQKAQRMKNMMANFLKAIGEDYTAKSYKMPAVDDLLGRQLVVVTRRKWDKFNEKWANDIEGFRPEGSVLEEAAASPGGLR